MNKKKRSLKLGGLKLKLKKENNSPYSEHFVRVLANNNLKIYDLTEKKNLMQAVSEGLFLNPSYSSSV